MSICETLSCRCKSQAVLWREHRILISVLLTEWVHRGNLICLALDSPYSQVQCADSALMSKIPFFLFLSLAGVSVGIAKAK